MSTQSMNRLRPVIRHVITKYNSSDDQWKSVSLEYGKDVVGLGNTPDEAVKNMWNELEGRTTWGHTYIFHEPLRIIKGRSTYFYGIKVIYYSLLHMLFTKRPAKNIRVSLHLEFVPAEKMMFCP